MEIRQENLKDYKIVYEVIKEAFKGIEHSDGNEQDIVVSLRNSDSFIPKLSLVAVKDEKTVGHILFSKVYIGESEELALAPLSVLPSHQRKGIGLSLINAGHKKAKELGYDYSIVLGAPKYYGKAGYIPAINYGIKAPFDVCNENFMAFKLNEKAKNINGTVQYDKAFGIS